MDSHLYIALNSLLISLKKRVEELINVKEEKLNKKLQELINIAANKEKQKIVVSKSTADLIQELSICIQYLLLDVEATRRELSKLKGD